MIVHRANGAQEGSFFIQRLTGPTYERGWNAQRGYAAWISKQKRWTCGVPCGVAAGFIGVANSAGRKTAGVWFALDQLLAGKFFNRRAITQDGKKGVVLFCRHAGEWLKPMAIMRGAIFNGPIFHSHGYGVGYGGIK